MSATTTLVLSFVDTQGNTANITVKNPKEKLIRSEVVEIMEDIISNEGILSNKGYLLDAVSDCYYRTVTEDGLKNEYGDGE